MSLIKYIIRRLIASIPVLVGAVFITFMLTKLMPGDPIIALLGDRYSEENYNSLYHQYGFDRPLLEQFLIYVGNLFTGNWGESYAVDRGTEVWNLISERFPRTMELAILSVIFSAVLGINSGVISATHRNKSKDTVIRGFSLVGVAMPVFWLGLMLQLLFAYYLDWFPMKGYLRALLEEPPHITGFLLVDSLITGQFVQFWDHVQHLVLPTIALGLIQVASITRQTRSSMLEVLEQDFIRTARAKGCTERTVIHKHALRNSLIPTSTVIGLGIAGLLGGAVLTETVFDYKGIGMLLISAISLRDYFLINAAVFLMTAIFVIVNLITDIVYGILDPRIRYD